MASTPYREIAEELKVSLATVYRVVSNTGSVRSATRDRIVAALNRHGNYRQIISAPRQVVFVPNPVNNDRLSGGELDLLQILPHERFHCIIAAYRPGHGRFASAVAEADIVVFCSSPAPEVLEETRRINPDIFIINFNGGHGGDIALDPDDYAAGELAAEHIHRLGHSRITLLRQDVESGGPHNRVNSFLGRMHLLNPAARIEQFICPRARMSAALSEYLTTRYDEDRPTLLYFTQDHIAYNYFYIKTMRRIKLAPEPGYFCGDRDACYPLDNYVPPLDRIFFAPEEIVDWAEYFIVNRPMLRHRSQIRALIHAELVVKGSVPDLNHNSQG